MASFDVIILGAGPGGYVCAIRCAQLGLKVAVVEGRETLGGTCLNVGCIPSKALLHASHMLHEAQENFEKMGLMNANPKVDWSKMQGYKDDVVGQNTKGIEFLFKKNKVTWLKGWATIPAPGKVQVGDEVHDAKNIVIATGSEPSSLPGVTVDETIVVTSTGALTLPSIPKSMVVIGAGVIGLEMGSVYSRLGTQVTVVEYLDAITPGMDAEVAKALQRILTKQGLKFVLGAAVQGDMIRVTHERVDRGVGQRVRRTRPVQPSVMRSDDLSGDAFGGGHVAAGAHRFLFRRRIGEVDSPMITAISSTTVLPRRNQKSRSLMRHRRSP